MERKIEKALKLVADMQAFHSAEENAFADDELREEDLDFLSAAGSQPEKSFEDFMRRIQGK